MIEIEKELNIIQDFPLRSRLHEEPIDPYLTIFSNNEITRYCLDCRGNIVPVVYRLVPKYKKRKNYKLKIGELCDNNSEIIIL